MILKKRYEVYVLLDGDRNIKYVGCTNNPERRRGVHSHTAGREKLIYETFQIFGSDRDEAATVEKGLIKILYLLGYDLLNHLGEETLDLLKEMPKIPKTSKKDEDREFLIDRLQMTLLKRKKHKYARIRDICVALRGILSDLETFEEKYDK
jgi:hypothetical protein